MGVNGVESAMSVIEKGLGQGTESVDKIGIGVVEGMSGRTSELWEIRRPLTVPCNEDEGDAISRIPHRFIDQWTAMYRGVTVYRSKFM